MGVPGEGRAMGAAVLSGDPCWLRRCPNHAFHHCDEIARHLLLLERMYRSNQADAVKVLPPASLPPGWT
jgi:hypothetical protein